MGVEDEFTDIDVWFLLPESELGRLDSLSETRFWSFELLGKKGHFNAESEESFAKLVAGCDMPLLYQLRKAVAPVDPSGAAEDLIRVARQPMKPAVRDAFFFYHYVEMRGEHRACDNPMSRKESLGVLFFLTKTIAHGLRAAMILDEEPYPYEKWLLHAARPLPTGRLLVPAIETILNLLHEGALRFDGPITENPINRELHNIRQVLIQTAQSKGINHLWLDKWWLFMFQARDVLRTVQW